MLVETLAISVLIALVFRGRISALQDVELKYMVLPFVGFLLEYAGGVALRKDLPFFMKHIGTATLVIELTAYVLICTFLYKNRRLPGMKIILAGTLMNFTVILLNGGYMPVDPHLGMLYGFEHSLAALENGYIFAHKLIGNETILGLLSDVIMIPPPWPFPKTISIGDVLIDIGAFFLIFKGMNAGHTTRNSL